EANKASILTLLGGNKDDSPPARDLLRDSAVQSLVGFRDHSRPARMAPNGVFRAHPLAGGASSAAGRPVERRPPGRQDHSSPAGCPRAAGPPGLAGTHPLRDLRPPSPQADRPSRGPQGLA